MFLSPVGMYRRAIALPTAALAVSAKCFNAKVFFVMGKALTGQLMRDSFCDL